MVLQRTFTVGIVIPDTFNMFQRQLFSIMERYLEGFGEILQPAQGEGNPEDEVEGGGARGLEPLEGGLGDTRPDRQGTPGPIFVQTEGFGTRGDGLAGFDGGLQGEQDWYHTMVNIESLIG